MTLWVASRVQRTTGVAVLFSVTMHALVLLALTQYSMRSQAALNLGEQHLRPPMEVMLLTQPMVALEAMVTNAVPDATAHSTVDKTPQRVMTQASPQTKPSTRSREIHAETWPIEDAVRDAHIGANPSDSLARASESNTDTALPSRIDGPLAQVSGPPVEKPHDHQPTQSARPDYAYNPQPVYPLLLRDQGVGGVVWLRVWVDSEGWPVEITLSKGSGYRLLDDAALRAVRQWRFVPAKNGEQRLASWVEFPIRFTLNG